MKKIGDLMKEQSFMSAEDFVQRAINWAEAENEAHTSEYVIDDEMRTVNGGECVRCRKPWREVKVNNPFGSFSYYEPQCTCELNDSEIVRRDERISVDMRNAGIPRAFQTCTFDSWDRSVSKTVNAAMDQARSYCDQKRWESGAGLVLHGAVGAGKTHCAVSVLRRFLRARPGAPVRFLPMADLLGEIIRHKGDGELTGEVAKCEITVVDDADKVANEREWARSQVFGLFDAIYREGRSLVVTTNAPHIDAMRERFGETVVSRWMERNKFVPFSGGKDVDYRLRVQGSSI